MATNKSMIQALGRIVELVEETRKRTKELNEITRELNAWRIVLKRHITAQGKQHGQDWNDHYEYDKKTGKCKRIYD